MTATTTAAPVIDLATIRSILYLGLKGDVALTPPEGDHSSRRAARKAPGPARETPRPGAVDTWA